MTWSQYLLWCGRCLAAAYVLAAALVAIVSTTNGGQF